MKHVKNFDLFVWYPNIQPKLNQFRKKQKIIKETRIVGSFSMVEAKQEAN